METESKKATWRALCESGRWTSFAWPGGYPVAYVCDDGGLLCGDCMNDKSNPIHFRGIADGWRIDGHVVLYEGIDNGDGTFDPEYCAHCQRDITNS